MRSGDVGVVSNGAGWCRMVFVRSISPFLLLFFFLVSLSYLFSFSDVGPLALLTGTFPFSSVRF
jgi:hypothetical protein